LSAVIKDLHNNIAVKKALSPVAIGTTGTGKTSRSIDTAGFGAVEVIINYGAITATAAQFTVQLLEGDVTGTMTAVAATEILGSNLNAGIAPSTPRTSNANMNVTKRLGYIGQRRYVGAKVFSTITAGTIIGIDVILGKPENAPVAT
jgi:hypothetical protein